MLIPKILTRVKDERYALIVLDPIYKGLGKRDENKAGDIASLCNEIEQLAVQSGAAVVFGAHYSKGNQAGKEAIDRIGGSGVFARDPDVILTMTPHEDENAYVVDLTLRALPQVPSFVVRWAGCIFQRDQNADATRVKTITKPGGKEEAGAAGPLPARQPCRPLRRDVRADAADGESRGDGAQRRACTISSAPSRRPARAARRSKRRTSLTVCATKAAASWCLKCRAGAVANTARKEARNDRVFRRKSFQGAFP